MRGIPLDLASLRQRFDGAGGGRSYWRSLEELAGDSAFLQFLHREFPERASEFEDPTGRREFLRLMGASLALAGLTACTRQPTEKIVPYVKQPEEVVPGRPLFFATAVTEGGYASGVLVESHMGRPTKIEGNPEHPASLGATDATGQAAILGLYDPDRSQTLTSYGEIQSWPKFVAALKTSLERQKAIRGSGLRILTETVSSPTLAKQMRDLLAQLPEARWHQWEPGARDNSRAGAILAFGEAVEVRYDLARADAIVSLDADFIGGGPGSIRYIREFAGRRKVSGPQAAMARLYAVESSPTLTGANADHRLPVRPSEVEGIGRLIAAGLGLRVEGASTARDEWVSPLVRDLRRHAGSSLVMVGEGQPPALHALGHAINRELGNVGKTLTYSAPVAAESVSQLDSLKELVSAFDAGGVNLLLILGGNPVYNAPAELDFGRHMMRVPLRIHLGLHEDETSERCHWHVPETHSLESWSDARAHDGTVTILQPLIAPLYEGKSAHEVMSVFLGQPSRTSYELVREYWKSQMTGGDFERSWKRALHDGTVPGTALPEKQVTLSDGDWMRGTVPPTESGLEIAFRLDPTVGDGRHANNGWLQELPKPLTKLTWDNAVLMSVATARSLGVSLSANWAGSLENGGKETPAGTVSDVVEVRYNGRSVRGPAWVVPSHPDGSVTLHLGYGRTRAGRVGTRVGFSAYALRGSEALWFARGAALSKTGEQAVLACTQDHWSMEGRNIIRAATAAEYEHDPSFAREMGEEPPQDLTLYPNREYKGHAWGMAIDLNSCVGCNACVTACQSENNIAVVGRDQVARGREMQWIRVDRYYAGDPARPETVEAQHQPVVCMQCENAPCEVVCPVTATVHSDEGLNDMVYNRCVGTRYCSNNCPYKVRRFNFYLYQDWTTPTFKMMRNPDVSIRSRGVMEKCTYCVQRINQARVDASNEGRPIRDGEIRTACQQACPAEAIVFGDINDAESRVSRLKAEPRNYRLLAELNTRPRTSYLAVVKNPNPEMPNG